MKSLIFFFFILFLLFTEATNAQTASDYAVQVTADIQNSPPQITLNWPAVTSTVYYVYKKLKSDISWGASYASLPGTATQFIDTNVTLHVSYEYKINRGALFGNGFGYINSGIEIPETDYRGKLLLFTDKAFSDSLVEEINTLIHDIEMDGWQVIRFDVNTTAPVDSIKGLIINAYQSDSLHVKAVFLFGHIPVLYSGNINPDGHPDHQGAWPADCFYGDINGVWTDIGINNTVASDPRNDNIPGDGKYDQSYIPSNIELQVGRVDFSNLPSFSLNELNLLRNYLTRNHSFRIKAFTPQYRAVVDDNFGAFGGEAFAASAYKNFAPLIGTSQVAAADYRTSLDTGSYIWSYGCGGGSYTSCGGVGTTSDFVSDSLQTIFTMLFGSYFGDWDRSDNLMRSALAQGTTLSISWSGRPHWVYHHMALGENIGYDAMISQNNSSLYFGNSSTRSIHIALLGDPTLRMHYVAPPSNLIATTLPGNHVQLTWTASVDSISGYVIYRRTDSLSAFIRLNQQTQTATNYTDSCLLDTTVYQYMVRAIKLQDSPSGSYFNLSTGVSDTAMVTDNIYVLASFTYLIQGDTLFVTSNNSDHAEGYYWTFGDGGTSTDSLPVYIYQANGNYVITLFAFSTCDDDTVSQSISITTAIAETEKADRIKVYPVPSHNKLFFETIDNTEGNQITIWSVDGKVMLEKELPPGKIHKLNIQSFDPGMYFITCIGKDGRIKSVRFIKN